MNKKTFGIAGCGFLGNIVADAYMMGLLEDYELIGVTGMPMETAVSASVKSISIHKEYPAQHGGKAYYF